jgi:hypothetical protein
MARRNVEKAVSVQVAHMEQLKCYLRESQIILRSLEEQKITARETFLYERRLSEARREHLQLQNELILATEKHNRLIHQKNVIQPA